ASPFLVLGLPAAANQRSRALGEQFQQNGMRHAAIDDDRSLDAALDGVETGLDLRDHPARDRAVGDELACGLDRELGYQLLLLVEHADHVVEEQEALGF